MTVTNIVARFVKLKFRFLLVQALILRSLMLSPIIASCAFLWKRYLFYLLFFLPLI